MLRGGAGQGDRLQCGVISGMKGNCIKDADRYSFPLKAPDNTISRSETFPLRRALLLRAPPVALYPNIMYSGFLTQIDERR